MLSTHLNILTFSPCTPERGGLTSGASISLWRPLHYKPPYIVYSIHFFSIQIAQAVYFPENCKLRGREGGTEPGSELQQAPANVVTRISLIQTSAAFRAIYPGQIIILISVLLC